MTSFLAWLAQQAAAQDLSTLVPSEREFRSEDVSLGLIQDDGIKRLFGVRSDLQREYVRLGEEIDRDVARVVGEMGFFHDPETCQSCRLRRQAADLQNRLLTVDAICWTEVRATLSRGSLDTIDEQEAMGGGGLAVCKGWQIVAMEPQPMSMHAPMPVSVSMMMVAVRSVDDPFDLAVDDFCELLDLHDPPLGPVVGGPGSFQDLYRTGPTVFDSVRRRPLGSGGHPFFGDGRPRRHG